MTVCADVREKKLRRLPTQCPEAWQYCTFLSIITSKNLAIKFLDEAGLKVLGLGDWVEGCLIIWFRIRATVLKNPALAVLRSGDSLRVSLNSW